MNKKIYIDTPINKIARVVTGKTPITADASNYGNDYMFISPSELHDGYNIVKSGKMISGKGLNSIKSNTIKGTSVLVGCIGWDMGNVGICHEECATNQQINAITDICEGVNPFYLYYWFTQKKEYLFSIASVTRTPILSKGIFEEIIVPIPAKTEQDKIVTILKSIDDKIDLNRKINDNLPYQSSMVA